jgi:hypothetical protein
VSADVPINFVPQLAVSLTPVCFGDMTYNEDQAAECISNLLTVGYRRLFVDLFWSAEHQQWQLCPVTDPSEPLDRRVLTLTNRHPFERGQDDAEYMIDSMPSLPTSNSNLQDPRAIRYNCSTSVKAEVLSDVLLSYFRTTVDDLDASFVILILNLHNILAGEQYFGQVGSEIPDSRPLSLLHVLNDTIVQPLGSYAYTPDQLSRDRRRLSDSWLSVRYQNHPMWRYFSIVNSTGGVLSTPDGWPSSSYLEKALKARVLFGLGTVDKPIQDSDFQYNSIFATGLLNSDIRPEELSSRCSFNTNNTDFSKLHSSWVLLSETSTQDIDALTSLTEKLVSCGISLLVNDTFGKTANDDVNSYRNISLSSAWSWASGEPYDGSTPRSAEEREQSRCAVMDVSASGHWRAADCSDFHQAACRVGSNSYSWVLSASEASFSNSPDSCPSNTSFDVPRTGLENLYLYHRIVSLVDNTNSSVWINFNSIDVKDCWTVGGPNATCHYTSVSSNEEQEQIVVPSVAAVIILILAALTLFVKCNANRRTSRRGRVHEVWEYEGVPA